MKEIALANWCVHMYVINDFVVNVNCISTIQIYLLFDYCNFQTINSSPKVHTVTLFS